MERKDWIDLAWHIFGIWIFLLITGFIFIEMLQIALPTSREQIIFTASYIIALAVFLKAGEIYLERKGYI